MAVTDFDEILNVLVVIVQVIRTGKVLENGRWPYEGQAGRRRKQQLYDILSKFLGDTRCSSANECFYADMIFVPLAYLLGQIIAIFVFNLLRKLLVRLLTSKSQDSL